MVARPFASIGINDDWSYIWTARVLARTGHFVYNGWATAMLGWFAYLGALFIKLFGFSFTAARSAGMVVSLGCAALMQRIFARLGMIEWTASVATLTLVLSPLFLPLAFSFMSDIPGLFVLVFCIYCCIRALQAESDNSAIAWLAAASVSNVVGGTVRQIAWLGVLLIVPSAAWCMRRRRRVLLTGALLWIISAFSIMLCTRWFKAQPYAVVEKIFFEYHTVSAFYAIRAIIAAIFLVLPIMTAFLVKYPAGKRFACTTGAITGAVAGALVFWVAVKLPRLALSDVPFAGDYVTNKGVAIPDILGTQPEIIPTSIRFLLTVLSFSALAAFVACLISTRDLWLFRDRDLRSRSSSYSHISNASLFALLAPFASIYLLLIVSRVSVWDRYFLPLAFVMTLCLLRIYTQVISDRLPRICLGVGLIFAAYGVACTHDMFAFERARIDATEKITAAGIPRTQLDAGFEYDAWTQLEQTSYVNEPRLLNPPGAYHALPPANLPVSCIGWFADYTPSIRPVLHLSRSPDGCYKESQFASVSYRTWLPSGQQRIYILAIR
jgi:Dolichyl-phosphate-mannose-protein mannosyltransferase